MVDATEVYTEYEEKQFQYRCRQFYCGALPDDREIMQKVLKKLADKIHNHRTFSPEYVAHPLEAKKMLTYDEYYTATNSSSTPTERAQKLYLCLTKKGEQVFTVVKFYHCLLQSSCNFLPHYKLAQELRQWALVLSGVKRPILADETVTGVPAVQVLDRMIDSLQGIMILEDDVPELCTNMNLHEDTIPSDNTDLSVLCKRWKEKVDSTCSPVSLVEVLMCTKGMGKHVSGLFCPCNSPEVEEFFIKLNQYWTFIPKYIGFSQDELKNKVHGESVRQCVQGFLEVWEMPDCGEKTLRILHEVARLAEIPAGFGPYSLPVSMEIMKYTGPADLKELEEAPPMKALLPSRSGMLKTMVGVGIQALQACEMLVGTEIPSWGMHHAYPGKHAWTLCPKESRLPEMPPAIQPAPSSPQMQVHGGIPHAKHPPDAEPTEEVHRKKEEQTSVHVIRDDNHPLIQCCKENQGPGKLRELLRQYGHLTIQQKSDGAHPIHLAIMCDSLEMVQVLVENDYNVDAIMDNHCTPLMVACQKVNLEIVTYLMKSGANIAEKDCNGYCCLHYKETLESFEILSLIIGEGGNELFDIPTEGDQLTPLTRACLIGAQAYQAAQYLLMCNANPNGIDKARIHPLTAAAAGGCEELVTLLLNNGAFINLQDRDGSTAILRACQRKNMKIVQILLDAEASLNIPDEMGTTTVISAIENGAINLLTLLLKFNPHLDHPKGIQNGNMNLQQSDICEITPVSLACLKGRLDMVELLLEKGANINYNNERTISALSFAVIGGHTQVVEFVLKQNQLQKGIYELKESFIIAVRMGKIYWANLILTQMGGMEKVLNTASAEGYNQLTHHVTILNEMRKGGSEEEEGSDEGVTPNQRSLTTAQPQLATCDEETSILCILDEFTQLSITSLVTVAGQDYVIEEARKSNQSHILLFYEQYFVDAKAIRNLFRLFMSPEPEPSPAQFLFELPKFDMRAFARTLQGMGRERLLEEVEVALLALPIAEREGLSGEQMFSVLFGPQFHNAVTQAGLPTASCPGVLPYSGFGPEQQDASNKAQFQESTASLQQKGSAEVELPQHSQQTVPLPQASPRKQKTKESPAVRSLSSSDARHKERNEQEPGTTTYLNGVPMKTEGHTPKLIRHASLRDRATSLSPGQGRKLPAPPKEHTATQSSPKKSSLSTSSSTSPGRISKSPGSKTATSEADAAHCSSSRAIPTETHGEASKAVSSPPPQTQKTQTSTGVAGPLEQHSHSTARLPHSDSVESYHSDGPPLSSQNQSHRDGSPQNFSHPAADSTSPQRTRTVHFSSHSDQQPSAMPLHTESQDLTEQHPPPHSSEPSHSEVPRPSLRRMDSAYHSHDGEYCTEYCVSLPSDTEPEEIMCRGALHMGYKKVQMRVTSGRNSTREFKLEEEDDSFINALRLVYEGSSGNIHVSLVFTV